MATILVLRFLLSVNILKSLASLGDNYRSTRVNGRSVDATVVAISKQSVATISGRHRIRVSMEVSETGNADAQEHSSLLRPTPLVYGRLCALLCASLLTLSTLHAVWQHKLIISRARKKVFLTIVWKVVNFNMLILLS